MPERGHTHAHSRTHTSHPSAAAGGEGEDKGAAVIVTDVGFLGTCAVPVHPTHQEACLQGDGRTPSDFQSVKANAE